MAAKSPTQKSASIKPRTLADILEDLEHANEATVQAQLAHMRMTPTERKAAEEMVAAHQGSRVFHIEDLVVEHEENAGLARWLPAGIYPVDLEA